jgi:hypothetical protein
MKCILQQPPTLQKHMQHRHSMPARQHSPHNMSQNMLYNTSQQLSQRLAPQQYVVPVKPPVGLVVPLSIDWHLLLPVKPIIFWVPAAKGDRRLLVACSTCSR